LTITTSFTNANTGWLGNEPAASFDWAIGFEWLSIEWIARVT